MPLLQSFDDRNRRILDVLNPEKDLYRGRVILSAEACQILRKARLGAVKRFQHRYRRVMLFHRERACRKIFRPRAPTRLRNTPRSTRQPPKASLLPWQNTSIFRILD